MRWLNSLAFVSLLALAVAETPSVILRSPILRQPLIKLAVQPRSSIDVEPVAIGPVGVPATGVAPVALATVDVNQPQVSPVAASAGFLPWGPQTAFWPGAQNWMGYNPYWGGYGQMRRRGWGRRFWRPRRRLVRPVEATTEAAAPVDAEPIVAEPVDAEPLPEVLTKTEVVESTVQEA